VLDDVDEGQQTVDESEPVVDEIHTAALSLPNGWEEVEDASTGETYYYHSQSGETSWERPLKEENEDESSPEPENSEDVETDDTNQPDMID
jgi:hypothetical protein